MSMSCKDITSTRYLSPTVTCVINAANLNYCHSNANFIGHVDVLRSLGRLHLHHRFSWFSSPRPDSMRAIDLCPMSSLVRLLRRSNSSLLSLLSLLATLFLYAKNFVAIDAIVFEMLLQKNSTSTTSPPSLLT